MADGVNALRLLSAELEAAVGRRPPVPSSVVAGRVAMVAQRPLAVGWKFDHNPGVSEEHP